MPITNPVRSQGFSAADCGLLILLLFSVENVWAYEQGTHRLVSEYAVGRSVLSNSDYLLSIGLGPSGANALHYHANSGDRRTISGLVSQGSYDEDELLGGTSVLHHFYDPQTPDKLSRGLRVSGWQGESSLDWALRENPRYSYEDAMDYFLEAFMAPTEAYRSIAYGDLFTSLGHIIHHIQDMAQPQHTRNEAHCPAWVCEAIELIINEGIDTPSLYEKYTNDNYATVDYLIASDKTYPEAYMFQAAADFWQVDHNASVPDLDNGMAAFSSTRFVTRNRNFSTDSNGLIKTPEGFPLPDGQGLSLAPAVGQCEIAGNQGSISGMCKHWAAAISDPLRNPVNIYIERYVAESITNDFLITQGLRKEFVLDMFAYEARWEILLPRAASLSAGFLNHFFRGRIDLVEDEVNRGVWYIFNKSQEPISGQFHFLYDQLGFRDVLQSFSRQLAPGAYTVISTQNLPQDTSRVAMVFEGQVGMEAGVIGVVKDYSAPATPCGGGINPNGGYEGLDILVELGDQPGSVSLWFNAYDIPDSLNIYAVGSGVELFSTGGKIAGEVNSGFYFNAADHGASTVRVKVVGGSAQTEWLLSLGCPQPLV